QVCKMAGSSLEEECKSLCSSSKNLLILISGASLSSKEYVGTELQANFRKLCLGLKFYDGANEKSLKSLKEDKKVEGDLLKLVTSLSKFVNLDEVLCYDLLCEYLLNDLVGEEFSAKVLLSYDRHLETFMQKFWNFYRWERLYTLLCIKTILAHHRDQQHPYHDLFAEFLQLVNSHEDLESNLFKQWEAIINTNIIVGKQETHAKAWMTFLLQEQYELLQVFLVFFKSKGPSSERFLHLLNAFINHGFGLRQANGQLLDDSMKDIVSSIGYAELLILLDNMQLHTLHYANNAKCYFLKESEANWNNVDLIIRRLGSQKEHGLLLLSWAVVRTVLLGDEQLSSTRTMAKSAQKLGVFRELSQLLTCSLFHGGDKVAVCCYSIVYTLLSQLICVYEESSIGDLELIWDVVGDLLKNSVSAERFWSEGFDSNLGLSVSGLLGKFPFLFTQPVRLLSKLANASASSAKKVLATFQNLKGTALPLNSNMRLEEIIAHDGNYLRLLEEYTSADGIHIPAGCIGHLVAVEGDADVIQWQQSISGFTISLRILVGAIQETMHGTNISSERVNEVIVIAKFISNIIDKVPTSFSDFQPLIDKIFVFIQRMAETHRLNKKIVKAFLKLAAAIKTKAEVIAIWRYIVQAGILPRNSVVTNNWNNEPNSTKLGQSSINFILASTERVSGEYSALTAFLNLIVNYSTVLVDEDDENYLNCVVYIAREIFPSYGRWWYANCEQREKIAQLCLKTFHNVLKFPFFNTDGKQQRIQTVILSSLLHHDTGYSLLKLVCIGEEAIQLAIAKQTNWITKSDTGVLYTVKLALSVLNRLLVVWYSGGKESSLMIQNLCSDPSTAHIVMGYVNHRFDSRLATLGVQLLKQFAGILPISLFVCLGTDASLFCRLLLQRLAMKVEDIRLKLAIFSLLETCVKFQPGITETFLACGRDENKEDDQPSSSCLRLALEILRNFEKDLCYTEELHSKTLSFLKTLWVSRQSLAVSDFKKSPDVWNLFATTLFEDSLNCRAKADVCAIFSEECLFKDSDNNSSEKLIEALDKKLSVGSLSKWISAIYNKYIFPMDGMQIQNNDNGGSNESNDATEAFLTSWKTFFIIGTRKGVLNVSPVDRRAIYESTIKAVEFLLSNPNINQLHLISEMLLHMSNIWLGCLSNAEKLCEYVSLSLSSSLLDGSTANITTVGNVVAVCIKLLFSLTKHHTSVPDDNVVSSWIRVACDIMQISALSFDRSMSQNKVDKAVLKVVILTSNLLKLLLVIGNKALWSDHLQRNSLINILLGLVVKSLRIFKAADGCCAILQLLSALSEVPEICDSIIAVGTVQTLSLPLAQIEINQSEAVIKPTGHSFHMQTWSDVYKETVYLMTKLLHFKRHLIAESVIDFASVHVTTFQTIPNTLIHNLDIWILDVSLIVLQFIYELSEYSSLWKLQTCLTLKKLVQVAAGIGYISIAFLLRPRLISHLFGIEENDKMKDDDQGLYKKIFTADDNSKSTRKLIEAFNKLLRMSFLFISIMCKFSPDLCELLADQCYDAGQWVSLLQINFNTPSVDHIAAPSYGTVISNVTVCLRILTGTVYSIFILYQIYLKYYDWFFF
ncbi:hypothetical protein CHUAL_009305, partial [Chamberlinius hualienensis]